MPQICQRSLARISCRQRAVRDNVLMSLSRREFLQILTTAAASGLPLASPRVLAQAKGAGGLLYDLPAFGNVGLLHFTDSHAQLLPVWFREPGVNIGVAVAAGRPPHPVGDALLR